MHFRTIHEKGTEGDAARFVPFFHLSMLGAALLPTGWSQRCLIGSTVRWDVKVRSQLIYSNRKKTHYIQFRMLTLTALQSLFSYIITDQISCSFRSYQINSLQLPSATSFLDLSLKQADQSFSCDLKPWRFLRKDQRKGITAGRQEDIQHPGMKIHLLKRLIQTKQN